jgi:hypothetical protein
MKLRILAVLLVAVAGMACTPGWARQNDSDVLLLMDIVAGSAGGEDGDDATQLLSDPRTPSIINDNAVLTLRVIMKNPNTIVTPEVGVGQLSDVTLRRYTVRYYRADGRSVEGVDVPYSISGEMNTLVQAFGPEVETSIIVVRHQAKMEPPLRNFTGFGGQGALTMFAEITVYGETISQRTVSATGRLEIVFIDFADEDA